jgi:hypothetical protein
MIKYTMSVVIGIAAVCVFDGCSRRKAVPVVASNTAAPSTAESAVTNPPPRELAQIGGSAAEIFDAARTSKWQDASVSLEALGDSERRLPSSGLTPDLLMQMRTRSTDLHHAVKSRHRVAAMDAANSLTRLVAELSSSYETAIPYKVVLLDYYGRQLELGLVASRPTMIRRATADLRQTWNSIEPTVLRQGGVEDARRFTDIVVQIEGARRPVDLAVPVHAELAEVNRMEKIFTP